MAVWALSRLIDRMQFADFAAHHTAHETDENVLTEWTEGVVRLAEAECVA
jgi:hypothetical protein